MAKAEFSVDISVFEKGRKRPDYSLNTDLAGEITIQDLLKWTKSALIVTADEILREEQSQGFDKEPIMVIDGKRNRNIDAVSPLGQIEFVSRMNFGDVLLDAYKGLLHRSKVLTGAYIKSHYVFLNGVQVATDMSSLEAWLKSEPEFKNRDTIRIVNIQPYARRLELLGVTAQRSKIDNSKDRRIGPLREGQKRVRYPNGAYQLTTRSIKSKYKQNVSIQFSFLPGTSLGLAGSFKSGRHGKNSAGRPYLYPSIVFTINERGIL